VARPRSKRRPWFDNEEADRVCLVFEKVLKHTEGKWAGTPFVLTGWQADDIIRPLFGWKRWDPQWEMWVRQYSNGVILLPRGNGKTELAGGVVVVLLCADGEYGAEVYSGADDKDQAKIVYRPVAEMVNLSRRLSGRLQVVESKNRIIDRRTNSFYQVLPRDRLGSGSQGFKVHGFVMDEYHTQKNKAFLNAMRKGMGKRIQPLGVVISTETDDPTGAAAEEFDYALKVHAGEIEDPSYFTYIRRAPVEAINDPFNEKHWYEANPALNDYLSIHTLRTEARQAQHKPSEVYDFLRFRLNIRTTQSVRWMPLDRWDDTAGISKEKPLEGNEELVGRTCYAGLHLGAVTDVVALILDFPDDEGGHDVLYRRNARMWSRSSTGPETSLRNSRKHALRASTRC
jgi:phage terminase large subunit-like protein